MSESESSDPDRGTAADAGNLDNADAGDAAALLRLLRGLASGMQPAAPALIKFDPDDKDADIEDWCRINEPKPPAPRSTPTTSSVPPIHREEKRPVTCYACGEQGHIASVCTAAADLRETNRVPRKEVKLCAKRVATGELHIAEEESPEDVRTSGRPCRREY
ncbi:uncharacterized protein LOC128682620 isoform X2 [Plodia interpunctella]|uniref:uncharacterized protein LOC128673215 isoform X2 n=1 Tax=Plodia interpunctella TaxID=58824 RepID=UPI00236878CA|nr:uncharacterized protein LOC128673215 isoform X2 [Plodia interpunctella]XP_053623452.1 uncharacterized protein LOC128682620 isoform X2 [Plodia interpunctella]